MKKTMIGITGVLVVITVVTFFFYPYWERRQVITWEGTYVRTARHEFGREWDTLVITGLAVAHERYQVDRRWKYERSMDGQALPVDYKVTRASLRATEDDGLFDESSGVSYAKEGNELRVGMIVYHQIK